MARKAKFKEITWSDTLAELEKPAEPDTQTLKNLQERRRRSIYQAAWRAAGANPTAKNFMSLAELVREWEHLIWLDLFKLRYGRLHERVERLRATGDLSEPSDWDWRLLSFQNVVAGLIGEALLASHASPLTKQITRAVKTIRGKAEMVASDNFRDAVENLYEYHIRDFIHCNSFPSTPLVTQQELTTATHDKLPKNNGKYLGMSESNIYIHIKAGDLLRFDFDRCDGRARYCWQPNSERQRLTLELISKKFSNSKI